MRLIDNPFYILGVEPTDDVGTIQSAYDRKSLVEDEERCRCAKDILLHPQRRIEAEVAWLCGVSTADVLNRCRHLHRHQGALSELAVTSFFPLADTNQIAASPAQIVRLYHLLDTRDEWSPDTLAEVGCQLGNRFLDVNCDALIALLNHLREVAGISLIRREAETADALQAYQAEIATCLCHRICAFGPTEQRRIVTEIVADVTNHGQRYANELVYRLVEELERNRNGFLPDARWMLAWQIQQIEKMPAEKALDDSTWEYLLQQIRAWGKWTLPLRLAAQSKGQRYTESDIATRIRRISIKAGIEYGRPDLALRLTEALLEHGALSAQWQAVLQSDKVRFEACIIATRATQAGQQEMRHKTNGSKAAPPAGNDTTDVNGMRRSLFAVTKTERRPYYEGNHANPAHITKERIAAQDNRYRSELKGMAWHSRCGMNCATAVYITKERTVAQETMHQSEGKTTSTETNHTADRKLQRTHIVSGYKRDNKVKKLVFLILGISILAMASCDGDNGAYIENEDRNPFVEWEEGYKSGEEDGWNEGYEEGDEDEMGYEDAYEGRYEDEYEEGYEEGDRQGYEDATAGYAALY